ncbi:helix-turn-helix domain protein [Leadbetterella byssophila DSM 17132]|uniref:Helix-turn-helix domain protein n=1 Tax=Leadbetterella byssophila (strain DSM 17132 / JCM 16389 / KACC 11308 / NBRC 106382 / 4M15) TaxID=649349 RepID=E4RVM5_LEAB4|nr:helix-turn-helix transcriptional regulator [Leadbetterella byssophila]ADQ17089.1 helix-turn-helix domain protein [Leadbetterella byssophila DSM 17132]
MSKINRLSEVFDQKGVRNNDIVKLLRVRKETVSRWVHNKQQPDLHKLYLIAEYLRVDIRELLHPSDWSKSKVEPFS